MTTPRPDLAPALQPLAVQAEQLGLRLVAFNSGSPRNPSNGVRIFNGREPHDYFAGGHLGQCRDVAETAAWLSGFSAARKPARYRIRHCEGNTAAWLLIRLRTDGSEIDSFGGYTTALSLDGLLAHAGHLTPVKGDTVELVP